MSEISNKKRIVAFGEIMQRLSPQNLERITEATAFDCCYGGSESNVLIALSAMGNNTSFVSVLPDNSLGKAVTRHLNRYLVDTNNILFKGDTLGSYYVETGFGAINSQVIYNRRFSEIARISGYEDRFDFDSVFCDCNLFHVSGISFALSKACEKLCFTFLKEAKKRNIPVSFDFNYRGKLWTIEEAADVYKKIMPFADIVFCSMKDIKVFLGLDNKDDFLKEYPCKYLIVRDREICKGNRHTASASIYKKTENEIKHYGTTTEEFDVLDRVGSGDAFAAGVIHSLLKDDDIEKALNFGLVSFVTKHFIRGDILTLNEQELDAVALSGYKDVNR